MKRSVLKRLLQYTKPYKGFIAGAVVSAVIQISLSLYGPILIGQAIDQCVSAGEVDFAAMIPILLMG